MISLNGIARARTRLRSADKKIQKMRELPAEAVGFEEVWYDFLTNFNASFSQLEQASKASDCGKHWFSLVKTQRKQNLLLSYLMHARNAEDHTGFPSIIRTGWVLKPITKGFGVSYRDETGKRRDTPQISATRGSGSAEFDVILPGVRIRAVRDRGKVYEFPQKMQYNTVFKLLKSGRIILDGGNLSIPDGLSIAVTQLEDIISDAEWLSRLTN